VLAEGRLEPQDVVDDVLGAVGEQVDAAGVALDHPGCELVARRVGHHPGVGLVADPQAVLGEQAGGVGVVGGDRRLEHLLGAVVVDGDPAAVTRVGEGGADARGQLAGRLGGERQAEDLVGRDLTGGDEVDDTGRHQRRLARARAGDDDGRLQGGRHRLPLLRADLVVGAHQPAEVGGGGDGERLDDGRDDRRGDWGHDSTVPECLEGHRLWKSQ
jgi:hypothetical protein